MKTEILKKLHKQLLFLEDFCLNYVDENGCELLNKHHQIVVISVDEDFDKFIKESNIEIEDGAIKIRQQFGSVISEYEIPSKYLDMNEDELKSIYIKEGLENQKNGIEPKLIML